MITCMYFGRLFDGVSVHNAVGLTTDVGAVDGPLSFCMPGCSNIRNGTTSWTILSETFFKSLSPSRT